jgi:hypothetical protein
MKAKKAKGTDTSGVKRVGLLLSCQTCGQEFFSRKDQIRKFCSHACSAKSRSSTVVLTCCQCQEQFNRVPSKVKRNKLGLYFCSAICKTEYNQTTKNYDYRQNFETLKCSRCGYDEFPCGIDVHHIDKNRQNNKRENLLLLCSPCHRALHKGLWKYGSDPNG